MFPFFGKPKEKKNFKEKRKGRRGNYTILITLAIMILFGLIYIALPARIIPGLTPTPTVVPIILVTPVPVPTSTSTLPPLQPTAPTTSGTPIVVAPLKPLILEALCSPGQFTSSWQVKNVNAVPVTFTYITQSFGTSASGTLTVPAMTQPNAAVLQFNSYLEDGGVIMRIFVNNELQAAAPGNTTPCSATSTPESTRRLTPTPARTRRPSPTAVAFSQFPDWAYLNPNQFGMYPYLLYILVRERYRLPDSRSAFKIESAHASMLT